MKRKVIMLDVDGVLNSFHNQLANEQKGVWRSERISLDEKTLIVLRHIVEATGAELVLSSTWRYPEHNGTYASKENLEKQLAQHGMHLSDETPIIDGLDRPGEILHYLNEHPEITHCVVLDDDTDIDAYEDLRRFWVYIDPKYGLQESHIEQVMEILKNVQLPENRKFETMLRVIVNNEQRIHIAALIRHDKKYGNIHETRIREKPRTEEQEKFHTKARKTQLFDIIEDEKK